MNAFMNELKIHFPFVYDDMLDFTEYGPNEVLIRLKDGSSVIFNRNKKSIRPFLANVECATEKEYSREFGRRLRNLLLNRGWTQMKFAKELGVSQATISCYITGRTCPNSYMLEKIIRILNCSPEELMFINL